MDGSFLVVVGYGSPRDTEHGFPAQLKGICTEASAIVPKKGPSGAAGVAGGSGANLRRERSPGDRVCFAHVAPRRAVRASVGWLPPQRTEASGYGDLVPGRNHDLTSAPLRQGKLAPVGLAEAGLVFLGLDLARERRMQRRLRRLTGRAGPVTLGRHGGDQLGAAHRPPALAQDPRCRIQGAELGRAPRWDGRRCLGWVARCGWPCRRALPRRGDLGRLLGCALGRGLLLGCHDASPWYKTGNRAVRLPRCPIRVSTVTSPEAPVQGNSEENSAFFSRFHMSPNQHARSRGVSREAALS